MILTMVVGIDNSSCLYMVGDIDSDGTKLEGIFSAVVDVIFVGVDVTGKWLKAFNCFNASIVEGVDNG